MLIERLERYKFDSFEFNNLTDVYRYIEDKIGKIIDAASSDAVGHIPAKTRLAIFEALITNREYLVRLLSASYLVDDTDLQPEEKSIFSLFQKKKK